MGETPVDKQEGLSGSERDLVSTGLSGRSCSLRDSEKRVAPLMW